MPLHREGNSGSEPFNPPTVRLLVKQPYLHRGQTPSLRILTSRPARLRPHRARLSSLSTTRRVLVGTLGAWALVCSTTGITPVPTSISRALGVVLVHVRSWLAQIVPYVINYQLLIVGLFGLCCAMRPRYIMRPSSRSLITLGVCGMVGVLCLAPTASTTTITPTRTPGLHPDLSLAHRQVSREHNCPCLTPTQCGELELDPCAAMPESLAFHNISYRARDYWRYTVQHHSACLDIGKCMNFHPLQCPLPPLILKAEGDPGCWAEAARHCIPRKDELAYCVLAALQFLAPYSPLYMSWPELCTRVDADELQKRCDGLFRPSQLKLVTTYAYEHQVIKLDNPVAVGKITLHTEATYTCTNEGDPFDCDSTQNYSCGSIIPSTTSDTAYDIRPPENLRQSHYHHALRVACSWTSNFLYELIEWVGLDPKHRLQTPVVWWRASILRASTEPYELTIHDVTCPDGTVVASYQILRGPTGDAYAAGDAAVADVRTFGVTAYHTDRGLKIGRTHAVMSGLNLQIYSVQFDTHNLLPLRHLQPYHQFAQCYELVSDPPPLPQCDSVRLTYRGLRHRDRGLYGVAPTPQRCTLEEPSSSRLTVITLDSQLLLVPGSVLRLARRAITVPPAPALPSPIQLELDKIKVQYNLLTFIAAFTASVTELMTDPVTAFQQYTVPALLLACIYFSVRKLQWKPAMTAAAVLYFLYLTP